MLRTGIEEFEEKNCMSLVSLSRKLCETSKKVVVISIWTSESKLTLISYSR